MNRELKFRVWLPQHNQLIYPHLCDFIRAKDDYIIGQIIPYFKYEKGLSIDAQFVNYNFSKDQLGEVNDYYTEIEYIVQQYTGLKDRDGKDIYEGDIIEHIFSKTTDDETSIHFGSKLNGSVSFCNHLCAYILTIISDDRHNGDTFQLMNHAPSKKIIGNVFENPDYFKNNE